MSVRRRTFLDSNVLVYLMTDGRKADLAESILQDGRLDRVISTQVINEFVRTARRKGQLEWPAIRAYLRLLRSACEVDVLRSEVQDDAVNLAERYEFPWYDSLIVASALAAGADTLLSEDYQDGMRVDKLRITNPFAQA
jgi:predicted nucleic acid-binding protein